MAGDVTLAQGQVFTNMELGQGVLEAVWLDWKNYGVNNLAED